MLKRLARKRLIEARELLAQGWTTGSLHRKKGGQHYYCSVGAINHTSGPILLVNLKMRSAVSKTIDARYGTSHIEYWNDMQSSWSDGHERVLSVFDEAIARLDVKPLPCSTAWWQARHDQARQREAAHKPLTFPTIGVPTTTFLAVRTAPTTARPARQLRPTTTRNFPTGADSRERVPAQTP